MKNMKKALFSILCVAFCVVIFACASGGGGGGGGAAATPGAVISGNWTYKEKNDSVDGGSSTIAQTVAEETIDGVKFTTYKFKGVVTNKTQYGLAEVGITPDDETLAFFKNAKAISFKILGDGRPYIVEAPISTVQDWGFHRYKIETEPGKVMEFKIEMRMFMQPSWANAVKFNQQRLTMLRLQTVNAAEGGVGPFEFKIWDLKVYQ